MAPAQVECARFPFSALRVLESEEDALERIRDARQPAASAAGKSSWTKYPRERTAGDWNQADCRFHEPATGSALSRAVSHLAPAASWEAGPVTLCEPSLFLVGQVLPFVLKQLIRNRLACH